MNKQLLWIPLLLGVPAAWATAESLAPAEARAGDLAELEAEYKAAFDTWKVKSDATSGRERAALRKEHPAIAFWDRFEAMGKGGEGRAYLWMLESSKDLGLKRDERGPKVDGIYTALLEGSADQPWFDQVISRIGRDGRYLGEERLFSWLEAASQKAKAPMAKALASVKLGEALAASTDDEQKLRGEKLLDAYERENILEGATALDFAAATIDGHGFNLSDYRGKAVLVDFYGFW